MDVTGLLQAGTNRLEVKVTNLWHNRIVGDLRYPAAGEFAKTNMKHKFNADMEAPATQKMISDDIRNGQKAGVRGTPTVFVNGKRLKSRSMPSFQKAIETELEKKNETELEDSGNINPE